VKQTCKGYTGSFSNSLPQFSSREDIPAPIPDIDLEALRLAFQPFWYCEHCGYYGAGGPSHLNAAGTEECQYKAQTSQNGQHIRELLEHIEHIQHRVTMLELALSFPGVKEAIARFTQFFNELTP
jgi:hypothetical protein